MKSSSLARKPWRRKPVTKASLKRSEFRRKPDAKNWAQDYARRQMDAIKTGVAPPRKTPKKSTKRMEDKKHLAFVRELPCVVKGFGPCDAHHLLRAPERGAGRRADDNHVLPLRWDVHQRLHEANKRETEFLMEGGNLKVEPIKLAEALYQVSGNHEGAENLIAAAKISLASFQEVLSAILSR